MFRHDEFRNHGIDNDDRHHGEQETLHAVEDKGADGEAGTAEEDRPQVNQ